MGNSGQDFTDRSPTEVRPFAAHTHVSYDRKDSDYEISFKNLTEADARDIVEAVAARLVVK
jgi:hypothetical protein